MNNTEKTIFRGKRISYLSLGCKVNAYETECIKERFEALGAVTVSFEEGNADAVIINTCSVTNIADRKSRQMLHRARKLNPNAVIIAAGCYVQAVGDEVKTSGDADAAVGNADKDSIVEIAKEAFLAAGGKYGAGSFTGNSGEKTAYPAGSAGDETAEPAGNTGVKTVEPAGNMGDKNNTGSVETSKNKTGGGTGGCHERTRAFIKVQDGCNQFCAYCIIPYVRGRVRSRGIEDVRDEALRLAGQGYREVVLTGIHLSSFGIDNYEKASKEGFYGEPLIELIEAVSKIKEIERIRLGSLEPRIITREFLNRISGIEQVCPHFHLSLQSGSDTVLKRMNRHYTSTEYENACGLIRETYELPSINTDIIVGFPGETEEEFCETCEFVEKIGFAKIHVFKYSRRKGTVADRMPDQVREEIKNERSAKLIAIDEACHRRYIGNFVGRRVRVLLEQENISSGIRYMTGLTERYVSVGIPVDEAQKERPAGNTFSECMITGISNDGFLVGESD